MDILFFLSHLFCPSNRLLLLAFTESHTAFVKHVEDELVRTRGHSLLLISLVDEVGKENLLNDAFYEHVVKYNSPQLTYITFDFHEFWLGTFWSETFKSKSRLVFSKALQFGNVLALLQLLDKEHLFRETRFFWYDSLLLLLLRFISVSRPGETPNKRLFSTNKWVYFESTVSIVSIEPMSSKQPSPKQ